MGTGPQRGSNACSWLLLMISPCYSFSPPCFAAERGLQVAECYRSAELGKGWGKNKSAVFPRLGMPCVT